MTTFLKVLLVIFATCLALPGVLMAYDEDEEGLLIGGIIWIALVFTPVVLAGVRLISYRRAAGTYALLLGLLWSVSPLAQHEIDRHMVFWIVWVTGEGVAVFVIWQLFRRPKKQAPNQAPEPTAPSGRGSS